MGRGEAVAGQSLGLAHEVATLQLLQDTVVGILSQQPPQPPEADRQAYPSRSAPAWA